MNWRQKICLWGGIGVLVLLAICAGGLWASGVPSDATIWVKCRDPNCQAEYEMYLRKYFQELEDYLEKHPDALEKPGYPPAVCEKCGRKSLYRAVKCEKCELVFEGGWKPEDFSDRCPECKYSTIEKLIRERAAKRRPMKVTHKAILCIAICMGVAVPVVIVVLWIAWRRRNTPGTGPGTKGG